MRMPQRLSTTLWLRGFPADGAGDATSVLIKIKSVALASRYAGKRWIDFFPRVGKEK